MKIVFQNIIGIEKVFKIYGATPILLRDNGVDLTVI